MQHKNPSYFSYHGDFSLLWEIFPYHKEIFSTMADFFPIMGDFSYHGRFFPTMRHYSYHGRFFLSWGRFYSSREARDIREIFFIRGDCIYQGKFYLSDIYIDQGRFLLTMGELYWPRQIFIDHGRFLLTMGDFYWPWEIQFFKKWETVCNFDNQSN